MTTNCKQEACAECRQRCVLLHGKGTDSTPLVSSFFKIMTGERFSAAIGFYPFFPPKFAPIASPLVGTKTFLEDSSGKLWKVRVSRMRDSYALKEGWNAFASEHGLELGDFLVFNHIGKAPFLVQINGKSACQKLDFSAPSNRRAAENGSYFPANDRPGRTFSQDSMEPETTKMVQVQSSHLLVGGDYEARGGVKIEILDVENPPYLHAPNVGCLIASQQPFLELPAPLPPLCKRRSSKTTGNVMVVYLRDPDLRLWPLLYHEDEGKGLRFLMSGWETLSKADNIQPGDECVSEVER